MSRITNMICSFGRFLPKKFQVLLNCLFAKTIGEGPLVGIKICALGVPESYVKGTYEKPIQNELASLLCSGDVFYDIGANFGFFSLLAAKVVQQKGQVYAFEPIPKNASMIELNARLNRFHHIKVINQAVSDKEQIEEIWITQHPGGATLTSTGVVPPDKMSKMAVRTIAIDILLDRGELRPPLLIKIDVEGAELQVLRGMSRTLKKYAPILVYELDDCDENLFRRKIEQTQSFLSTFGYGVTRLTDAYPADGWHVAHFVAKPQC